MSTAAWSRSSCTPSTSARCSRKCIHAHVQRWRSAVYCPHKLFPHNVPVRFAALPDDDVSVSQQTTILEREKQKLRRLGTTALHKKRARLGVTGTPPNSTVELVSEVAAAVVQAKAQVVSFPLKRTPKSMRAAKGFIVVPVDIEDVGFVQFLLDSGSSGVLITGEVRELLGLSPLDGQVVKGVDSSGLTLRQKVKLPPLRIGQHLVPLDYAYVTTMKADHDTEVGGVLGLSFLRMFEIDIDFREKRVSFHPRGHIDAGLLDVSGMSRLDCHTLRGGLLAVPVSLNGSQPFHAILDLAANFSTINWLAAEAAGYSRGGPSGPQPGGRANMVGNMTQIVAADGSSTTSIKRGFLDVVLGRKEARMPAGDGDDDSIPRTRGASIAGAARLDSTQQQEQQPEQLATHFVPRSPMAMLVRDVPSFAALGYGEQAMMVLGLDLLGQGRLVLALGEQRLYVMDEGV